MKNTLSRATIAASLMLVNAPALSASENDQIENEKQLEIVVVTGVRRPNQLLIDTHQLALPGLDNSDLLRQFPGGNRNANGPLTRISQYRGLYGSENSVDIDGVGYTSGGPNWMDTPLSSIPQSLTESVTLYRGLGSVEIIQEGLGGGIHIESLKGGYSQDEEWSNYGNAEATWGSNASAWGGSLFTGFHNQDNRVDVAVSIDKGDDYKYNGGVASATQYDRSQYRLGYGRRFGETELGLGAVINRTGASGTPALPMDIRYIDSEMYSLDLESPVGTGDFSIAFSTLSVDHVMDNYSLRPPPLNMNGQETFRETTAFGKTQSMKAGYQFDLGRAVLMVGVDGNWASHTANIADPTNPSFFIMNFNDVQRDRAGIFSTITWEAGAWALEGGIRYNHLKMDAGEVDGNLAMMPGMMPGGMPGMMQTQQDRLDELADDFNSSDRRKIDHQWSGILLASRNVTDTIRLNLGVGRKVRSPSYQERYLWLPMEATAGLADGHTYIGDIDLKPEKSIEFTAGFEWTTEDFNLSPELFYRDINGFIQGVPSTNMTANQFAIMMSGQPPLQFANIDAEIYGIDMGYEWNLAKFWVLRGNVSYVRGKRTDIKDNLYRIAPLSSFVELMYVTDHFFISAESESAAKQDKVAAYDDEQTSAGWGILNLRAGIDLGKSISLGLGVENLFNKAYQDHLGGYSRVRGSDIPLGTRLFSMGRNIYVKLNASW